MPAYFLTLLRRSWRMFTDVMKVVLPVMVIVQLGEHLGLVQQLGRLIGPGMAWLNLPAEAGIVWVTTALIGIYGGLASLAGLSSVIDLTHGQLSALGAMMLLSHSVPIEQSVVRRAGASFGITATLRIACALLYGAAVSWASALTGVLDTPVSLAWMQGSSFAEGSTGLMAWLQGTLFSLVLTFIVIVALVVVLDVLERLGITRRITTLMMPVLRASGLDARVAPVTTVGVLLGLTYGGALIIDEARRQNFSPRTRFLALTWLSLSHALIEDTLLIVALGADIWVVLVGRVLLTLAVVSILARATASWGGAEPAWSVEAR